MGWASGEEPTLGDDVRTMAGTLGVAVLAGSVLAGTGSGAAAAEEPVSQAVPGPAVAYTGVTEGRDTGLFAVDSGTGRQWLVADGFSHDAAWSPGGTRIAWITYGDDDLGHVQVANADGTARQQVDGDGDSRSLAWSPDGTLAWFHRPSWFPTDCTTDDRFVRPDLVLQNSDGTTRALGTAAPTATDLQFSPDGATAVWRERGADVCGLAPTTLVVADVATGRQSVVAGADDTTGLSFSPDSSTIALARDTAEGGDVVLVDIAARTAQQVVTPEVSEEFATFVDDGSLAVVRGTSTGRQVSLVGRDGALVRDLVEAPEYVETLLASTDRTSVLVAGRSLPSADGASFDVTVWRQPLDGSPSTAVAGNGQAGVFEATVASWASNAPVVERRTRTPR